MSMFKHFFEIGQDASLFHGLKIADEKERVFDTYTPFTNPVGIEMPIFFCQILIFPFHVTLRCGII